MEKVLIANRGEIALRIIRACRELGLRSVAVHSSADAGGLWVRKADEAVDIGKPAARHSYLNADVLLEAAQSGGADAVHPGYGFLSENATFARRVADAGLTWVGPPADVIQQMGDKAAARRVAERAGVPVVPGSAGTVATDEALDAAAAIGYPVMIKAAGGGGGRGIHVAEDAAALTRGMEAAGREAESAFGNRELYLEKLIIRPRHVEVQVMADGHGNAVHLFERECSLQRRRQKLLEESPAPGLPSAAREEMTQASVRLALEAGYVNAGTVVFVVDAEGAFYFIEMNTRIQVEHPVTEMVTGLDLVKEQLRVAAGEGLGFSQDAVRTRGAAIEFRINAEDPDAEFQPCPGKISDFELPGGPGVRVDTAIFNGYTVPPFYDSMIAKLIVWGVDRPEAVARGRRALEDFVIGGIKTTIPFHLRLLASDGFRRGEYHTEYLAEHSLG
ncbi:MAG: acetyl-CoA carboxylase biotin carboxylase subunit [Actinomycetota bacterium]|nr:acetyl-CoA carboxylase biotin carboxylase subunit [Actinomycetota bacterium]